MECRADLCGCAIADGDKFWCRAIELLEHSVRVIGRVLADRVGQRVGWMGCGFGFKGVGWMQYVFVVRRVRHLGCGDCIYNVFVYLERSFGEVPKV